MKTDLDELNEYLLKASQANVGVRRKVVLVEQWLRDFKKRATAKKYEPQLAR